MARPRKTENLISKILKIAEKGQKNSEADRLDAERAFKFFYDNLNDQDNSNSTKEALSELLKAKIAANNSGLESAKIILALEREKNRKEENKKGDFGEEIEGIDLGNLANKFKDL